MKSNMFSEKTYLIWEVIICFYMCFPGRKAFANESDFGALQKKFLAIQT